MTLKDFFKTFELFADAPNAVEKMRDLVLHLAINGKLGPQNTHDEPAELLLNKIECERQTGGITRRNGAIKHMVENELRADLPNVWTRALLIELVIEIQTGPFGSSLHKSDYQVGGVPVINPASIGGGKIVPLPHMAIGRSTLKRLEVFKLKAGDIVMARRGEMGRCAIVTEKEDGWLCGTGSLVLRMPNSFYAPYLAMVIGSPTSRAYLGEASVGATMQNLNQSILAKMPIAVPPLPEQKRIVAKVDELMALCDQLEAQQKERETRHAALARASLSRFAEAPTPANLNLLFHKSYDIAPADLRQSILTLAVQGKLVSPLPEERLSLDFEPDVSDHFEIPLKWKWVTLEKVAQSRLGKMVDIQKNRGKPQAYLRNTNVHWFRFELDSIKTMLLDESELDEYRVKPGDVLICEGGHGIARSAVWSGQIRNIIFQKALHRVRPSSQLNGHFLTYCLRVYEHEGILQRYYTGAGIPHFTGKSLAKVVFPLPPLGEQRRIVAKVNELMVLVDALETQLTASQTKAAQLMEAVVAELTGPVSRGRVPEVIPIMTLVGANHASALLTSN